MTEYGAVKLCEIERPRDRKSPGFSDLNGHKSVPGLFVKQDIRFKLDRKGAVLSSEASMHTVSGPSAFIFDQPFLVFIRKRDCDRPFFVMWVDNADYLVLW